MFVCDHTVFGLLRVCYNLTKACAATLNLHRMSLYLQHDKETLHGYMYKL